MVRLGSGCRRACCAAARGVAKPRAASGIASRQRVERRSRAAARKRSFGHDVAARALRVAGCSCRRAQAEHWPGVSLSRAALLCHAGADAAPPPRYQAPATFAQRAAPPLRTESPNVGARASAPVSGAVPRPSSALTAGALRSSAAAPRASASPSPLRRLATELRVRSCYCMPLPWLTPGFFRTQSSFPAPGARQTTPIRMPSVTAAARSRGASPAPLTAAARASAVSLAAASAAAVRPRYPSPSLARAPALPSFGSAARAVATGTAPRRASDGPDLLRRPATAAPPASAAPPGASSSTSTAVIAAHAAERERLEREVARLQRAMAAQAVALHNAERDAAALRAQLVERDAACAQLGALLAAVHRQELRPDQLSEFAAALPSASAAPQPAAAAVTHSAPRPAAAAVAHARPTRSPFHGVPAEEVTWDAPLSSRPALERPPMVPPLSLGALRFGDGGGHVESPPQAGVRAGATRGSRGSDSASSVSGLPRPGSRGQARN